MLRKKMPINKFLSNYSDWSVLFIRLGVGIIFLVHGLGKLFNIGPAALGIASTAGYFESLGIPASLFFAWVVALVETIGGLFILLGLFTRASALLVGIDIFVAIILVHIPNGFSVQNGGIEFPLLLFLGAISLVFSGAGKKLALEKAIRQQL